MTGFPPEALGCPLHTNLSEASDRQDIRRHLGDIVNPLMEALHERVTMGEKMPIEALSRIPVIERSYDEVRDAGTKEHSFTFPREERGAIVARATDRFDSCLEADLSEIGAVSDLAPLRIPVGYDAQYAQRLIRAAAGVAQSVRMLRPRIREVALQGDNSYLLLYHTHQGVMTRDPGRALERILSRGAALSAQAEAVLTADPVEGFGSARDLARAVRESDLPKNFTLQAGSGMLSTIVRHGRRIRQPVVRGEGAQLELSGPLKEYERATRPELHAQVQAARRQVEVARGRVSSATGEQMTVGALRDLHRKQYGASCPAACVGVPAMLETIAYVADRVELR